MKFLILINSGSVLLLFASLGFLSLFTSKNEEWAPLTVPIGILIVVLIILIARQSIKYKSETDEEKMREHLEALGYIDKEDK